MESWIIVPEPLLPKAKPEACLAYDPVAAALAAPRPAQYEAASNATSIGMSAAPQAQHSPTLPKPYTNLLPTNKSSEGARGQPGSPE